MSQREREVVVERNASIYMDPTFDLDKEMRNGDSACIPDS